MHGGGSSLDLRYARQPYTVFPARYYVVISIFNNLLFYSGLPKLIFFLLRQDKSGVFVHGVLEWCQRAGQYLVKATLPTVLLAFLYLVLYLFVKRSQIDITNPNRAIAVLVSFVVISAVSFCCLYHAAAIISFESDIVFRLIFLLDAVISPFIAFLVMEGITKTDSVMNSMLRNTGVAKSRKTLENFLAFSAIASSLPTVLMFDINQDFNIMSDFLWCLSLMGLSSGLSTIVILNMGTKQLSRRKGHSKKEE